MKGVPLVWQTAVLPLSGDTPFLNREEGAPAGRAAGSKKSKVAGGAKKGVFVERNGASGHAGWGLKGGVLLLLPEFFAVSALDTRGGGTCAARR